MANWIKRTTRTWRSSRQTTTYNKGKGTTKSSSYKLGDGPRITTSIGPGGKIKRTVTQKSIGGYTKRTTTTLNKKRRK